MTSPFVARIQSIRQTLRKSGIDFLALVPGPNLFYLTGLQMHASERLTLVLVPARGKAIVLAPALELPRIRSRIQIPAKVYGWRDDEGPDAGWLQLVKSRPIDGAKIAVEYLTMRVMELSAVRANAKQVKIVDASSLLANQRMTKDDAEIDAMRRAARVLDMSLEEVMSEIRIGMTEKEIAAIWQLAMKTNGADTFPEPPIVASGPNSANPHTTATDRKLERGEFVIFDGWCQVDGYFGDTTRTAITGEPDNEHIKVYNAILRANQAGIRAARIGVMSAEVDRAARAVIEQEGYGRYFLHRTGHGLGLEVHEPPFMVEGSKTTLQVGMTFTVEPGIYIEGRGGVRIEDDVVITQDGAETLTKMHRELRVIG